MSRNFLWAGILLGLAFVACNTFTGNGSLEGIYVNHSQGEYSISNDTLVVEQGQGKMVLIHRRTAFRRFSNGRAGKREFEREEWSCVWNPNERTFEELRRGRLVYVDCDSARLILGKRVYRKLR